MTYSDGRLSEPEVPKIVRKSLPVFENAGLSPVPASQDKWDALELKMS